MTDTKQLMEGGAIDLVKLLPLKEGQRVVVTTDFEWFKWKIYPSLQRAMKALPKAFHVSYNAKQSSVDVAANRRFKDDAKKAKDDGSGSDDDGVEPHGNDYIVEVYPVTLQEYKEHFENNPKLLETESDLAQPPQPYKPLIEISPGYKIGQDMLDFYKTTRLPELLAASTQSATSVVCLAAKAAD